MTAATVSSKGRITIPADIRRKLNLVAGSRVVITQLDDGAAIMRAKVRSTRELKGILKSQRGAPEVSVEKMRIGRD